MSDTLLEPLLRAFESGNWPLVSFIVAITLAVNARAIVAVLGRVANRREDFVKAALELEAIKGAARSVLEEEINHIFFRKVTGIPADRHLRNKIKEVVDRTRGEIQLTDLARIRGFLRMKAGKLQVCIETVDKVEWLFNWLFAFVMSAFAVGVFVTLNYVAGISAWHKVALATLGMGYALFALFLVSRTVPLSLAKKLAPVIQELEESKHAEKAGKSADRHPASARPANPSSREVSK